MPRQLSAREIADDLAARIHDGQYPPGSRLPTWDELATLYSVHRATIYRAVSLLQDRGLVFGRGGAGSFVRDE